METILVVQMVIAIALAFCILLQKKSAWFSWAIGWAYTDNQSFYWNKRWMALFLHNASVVLSVLLFANALFYIMTWGG